MSRQLTTMGLRLLSRRSSLLLCVPSKTLVRRLLSNVAQQPVGKTPMQGPRQKVSHKNHRKGTGRGGKSNEEAALAAVGVGEGGMAPPLSGNASPPPQAVNPFASMKKTNGVEVAAEAVGGKKTKQPQQQQQPNWNNQKQQQQQQQSQLGVKPNGGVIKNQQQQQASGGGKHGNAAAKFRQQQGVAAQRGQSLLGVGGVGELGSSSSSTSSSSSSSSFSRFANTVTMPDGSRMSGRAFVAGAAASASVSESSRIGSSSSSSSSMMDAAIFERFSNIGDRLANGRKSQQQQQQQQQRKGSRQQQQYKTQQEHQQRGGLLKKNGRLDQQQQPSPSSTSLPPFPPPHHQHPQPNNVGSFARFNFGADSSSNSNSNSSHNSNSDLLGGGGGGRGRGGGGGGRGGVGGGGRWGLPQTARAVAPTAPLPPPSHVLAPMAEPGQVQMWEVELGNRIAPAPRIPFPSREEHHQQHRQQSRLLRQQQQHRRRDGGTGGGQQQRRNSRRLKALQTVPLVLPREPLSVRDLSQKLSMKINDVVKRLVSLGGKEEYGEVVPETIVDLDVAELLGLEMGRIVKRVDTKADLLGHRGKGEGEREGWPLRAPVVCVMGHVDHGKTTLLDALRRSRVAAAEAGGITQRLGAFHIASAAEGEEGREGGLGVTVLDTPGHAAFGAMRAHGAQATDIVLLVVSAVDGLQEQTKEIVRLLAEQREEMEEGGGREGGGGPSLMVAVTKVDKLGGKEEVMEAMGKIVHALAAEGVMCEDLGGEVQVVPVSAPTGEGLEELMERLQLQAEMLELRASREGPGEGVVLDAYMDRGLGVVTNVLMQWGALCPGDVVVAGTQWGRVKLILGEDQGGGSSSNSEGLAYAWPSMPVRLLGLRSLPVPGEVLMVVKSEERAESVVEARKAAEERQRYEEMEETEVMGEEDEVQLAEILEKNLVGASRSGKKTKAFLALQRGSVDDALESSPMRKEGGREGGRKEGRQQQVVVPFLVKADGKGTLEALTSALAGYDSDVIKAEVIGMGCGPVTEGDVERAKAAAARDCDGGGEACTILAFNVGFVSGEVGEMARREGVSVKRQEVIYALLDDVKATLQEHMPMERVEASVGRMEVQATFALTGRRKARNTVAGCKVLSGGAFSGSQYRYRVMRKEEGREGGVVVCDESSPATLYHFKEQVQEVKKGSECGLSLDGYGAFEAGDLIECYTVTMKPKQIGDIFRY